MSSFEQTIDDRDLQDALQLLEARGTNLRPALLGIGEAWIGLVKASFATSTSPFGDKWAPNAAATYSAHLARFSGSYSKKAGKDTKPATETPACADPGPFTTPVAAHPRPQNRVRNNRADPVRQRPRIAVRHVIPGLAVLD